MQQWKLLIFVAPSVPSIMQHPSAMHVAAAAAAAAAASGSARLLHSGDTKDALRVSRPRADKTFLLGSRLKCIPVRTAGTMQY